MRSRLPRLSVIPVVWALTLAAAPAAQAAPIFSNFGPGFSYDITTGNPVGDPFFTGDTVFAEGVGFATGSDATIGSVSIALGYVFSPPPLPFSVALMSDVGGLPAVVLESFTIVANSLELFGNNNAPVVLTSLLNPVLSAGNHYWLTVIAPSEDNIAWNLNNTSDTSPTATSIDGGATWL